MDFKIVLHKAEEGGYYVTVPSLPGCFSQGETKAEALRNVKGAITLHMETLAQDGEPLIRTGKDQEVSKVEVPV